MSFVIISINKIYKCQMKSLNNVQFANLFDLACVVSYLLNIAV